MEVQAHLCMDHRKHQDRPMTTVTTAQTDQILRDGLSSRGHTVFPMIPLREDWMWRSRITGRMAINESRTICGQGSTGLLVEDKLDR